MGFKKFANKLNDSMIGYLPIKVLEGIIGMVMLKVYTSLFSPDPYGQYSIINSTINIIFLVYIGWMHQAIIRFTNEYYHDEKKQKQFFSSIILTWFVLVSLLSCVFVLLNYLMPSFIAGIDVSFAIILVFVFIGYSISQMLLTLLIYAGKRLLNATLLLSTIVIKLVLTIVLYHTYSESIISIFISHGITDFVMGTIALVVSKGYKSINFKYYSGKLVKKFIKFGYPLIGLALTMSLLNVSDRYVIIFFQGEAAVGIYSANYAVPAAVFSLLMAGLSRGIYPKVLHYWNHHSKEEAINSLSLGGKYYLMLCLPAATGLFLLSEPIARIFTAEMYVEGNQIIGLVAFGMFFLGLSEYFNKGWELSRKTMPILINCIIASIVNMILNIIFVPIYGYVAAGFTTLVSFVVYMLLSKLRENKGIRFTINRKTFLNILLSTLIMAIIVIVCKSIITVNIISILIIVAIAALAYFSTLYFTGEIKNELKRIRR
jgi:O-antigen/teichoic acid export membrane protein